MWQGILFVPCDARTGRDICYFERGTTSTFWPSAVLIPVLAHPWRSGDLRVMVRPESDCLVRAAVVLFQDPVPICEEALFCAPLCEVRREKSRASACWLVCSSGNPADEWLLELLNP